MDTSSLIIPHPRLKERRFALEPMLEICPGIRDPQTGVHYAEIVKNLPGQGVKLLERNLL